MTNLTKQIGDLRVFIKGQTSSYEMEYNARRKTIDKSVEDMLNERVRLKGFRDSIDRQIVLLDLERKKLEDLKMSGYHELLRQLKKEKKDLQLNSG